MNNPANAISAEAQKQGLSYWEYMANKYPHCVQNHVWGAKKPTRKESREMSRAIMSHPRFRWIKGLLGQRAMY